MGTDEKHAVIISQLEMEIKSQFGSVRRFAETADLDYFNLNKILRGRVDISLAVFMRVCTVLKISDFGIVPQIQHSNTGTLRQYLTMPYQKLNDAIFELILK